MNINEMRAWAQGVLASRGTGESRDAVTGAEYVLALVERVERLEQQREFIASGEMSGKSAASFEALHGVPLFPDDEAHP